MLLEQDGEKSTDAAEARNIKVKVNCDYFAFGPH